MIHPNAQWALTNMHRIEDIRIIRIKNGLSRWSATKKDHKSITSTDNWVNIKFSQVWMGKQK